MAAKSIDEAITNALSVGRLSEIKNGLKLELRDFFSHEIMKQELLIENDKSLSSDKRTLAVSTLHSFFERVFKTTPAMKGEKS